MLEHSGASGRRASARLSLGIARGVTLSDSPPYAKSARRVAISPQTETGWALGAVVGRCKDPGKESLAGHLFRRALQAIEGSTSPRAWAFALLGIAEYLRAFRADSNVQAAHKLLAERLLGLYLRSSSTDWPWFEDRATYENARLSQAMIASGSWLNHEEMLHSGLRSLEWLLSVQTLDGHFAPIGCNGFYSRGHPKATFDQQPLEAWATVSACLEARRATGDERWVRHARLAFGWFLGQNHLQRALYDDATGGCRDGLHAERINENQGAESTLSFQLALLEMREIEPSRALRLVAPLARTLIVRDGRNDRRHFHRANLPWRNAPHR